jgi:hypothetical protein
VLSESIDNLLDHIRERSTPHVLGRSREHSQCSLDEEVLECLVVEKGRIPVFLLEVGVDLLHKVLHFIDSYVLIKLMVS